MLERKGDPRNFKSLLRERKRLLETLKEIDSRALSLWKPECTPYSHHLPEENKAKLNELDVLIRTELERHRNIIGDGTVPRQMR